MLALLLLLSQQLGISHALTHVSLPDAPRTSQEEQLPGEMQCEECLAFASIGSALAIPPLSWFTDLASVLDRIAVPVTCHLPCLVRAFDSRAPPSIS